MKTIRVGSVLLVQGDKFFLIKSKVGPAKGLWNNPGGKLESGESFKEGAKREAFEETGLLVELGKLINTYHFQDHNNHQVIKKVFEVKIVKGKIKIPPREIADARWFTFSEIKEMNPAELTFGAIQSIHDFISKKHNQTYYPDRIA